MLEHLALTVALTLPGDPIDRHPSPSRAAVSRIVEAASLLPARWRAFGSCVINRESHGNPRAVNHSSGAAGLVQFLPAWRHGLPYMVADRLRHHGVPATYARTIRLSLPTRIEAWPARYQLVGFAEVIDRGGWRHWTGGHGCNGLIP